MMTAMIIAFAGLAFGLAGLAFGLVNWRGQRAQRELLEFLAKQNEDLEKALDEHRADGEEHRFQMIDHARKIAWLETRARRPQSAAAAAPEREVSAVAEPDKLNIGERRHRVLKLAAMGQDAATIAAKLGMMAGEVELIIKLNR